MKLITIENTSDYLMVTCMQEDQSWKSTPCLSQKGAEQRVTEVHNACKGAATYKRTHLFLDTVDWYDSCDSFTVPGASMAKGARKATDRSWESNDIPKGFEINIAVRYQATSRTARPLKDSLTAFGILATPSTIKEIQKALKKTKEIYIYNGQILTEYPEM